MKGSPAVVEADDVGSAEPLPSGPASADLTRECAKAFLDVHIPKLKFILGKKFNADPQEVEAVLTVAIDKAADRWPDLSNPRGFVFTVASNLLLASRKPAPAEVLTGRHAVPDGNVADIADEVVNEQFWKWLLAQLPEEQRIAVRLLRAGYRVKEIAVLTKRSENATSKLLARARSVLRPLLCAEGLVPQQRRSASRATTEATTAGDSDA